MHQTREHNKANEIVTLGGTNTYVASDKNGNMTRMPKPEDWTAAYDCVYDAWNRLVQVKDGNAVLATYVYNGLNQRIRKTIGATVTESVFNRNWQELESKTGSVTTTCVWGLRYIDDLVCRDRGSERLYAIQDANWNVTAITDTAGVVKERISYDTFGKPNWLSASYGSKTTSGYAWNRTFTGQVFDSETGLMLYRNRFYHPGLGRFVTRERSSSLKMYVALQKYVNNAPVSFVDYNGLSALDSVHFNTMPAANPIALSSAKKAAFEPDGRIPRPDFPITPNDDDIPMETQKKCCASAKKELGTTSALGWVACYKGRAIPCADMSGSSTAGVSSRVVKLAQVCIYYHENQHIEDYGNANCDPAKSHLMEPLPKDRSPSPREMRLYEYSECKAHAVSVKCFEEILKKPLIKLTSDDKKYIEDLKNSSQRAMKKHCDDYNLLAGGGP